jgi:hypothetical protein
MAMRPWALQFCSLTGTLRPRHAKRGGGAQHDAGIITDEAIASPVSEFERTLRSDNVVPRAWASATMAALWEEEETAFVSALVSPDAEEVRRLALLAIQRELRSSAKAEQSNWTMAVWGCTAAATALLLEQNLNGESSSLIVSMCGTIEEERAQLAALAAKQGLRSVAIGVRACVCFVWGGWLRPKCRDAVLTPPPLPLPSLFHCRLSRKPRISASSGAGLHCQVR